MDERTWKKDIKRLLQLKTEGIKVEEDDMDEVAEYYGETRDEVIACLIAEEINNIDLTQDATCTHCGKVISLEEASAFNGSCEECDNKE